MTGDLRPTHSGSAAPVLTHVAATMNRQLAGTAAGVPSATARELVGGVSQGLTAVLNPLVDLTATAVARTPVLSVAGPLIGIEPQVAAAPAPGLIVSSSLGLGTRACRAGTTYRLGPRGRFGACGAGAPRWRGGLCSTGGVSCPPVRDRSGGARTSAAGEVPDAPPADPATPSNTTCGMPPPSTPDGWGDGARAVETHVAGLLPAPRTDPSIVIRTAADEPALFPD